MGAKMEVKEWEYCEALKKEQERLCVDMKLSQRCKNNWKYNIVPMMSNRSAYQEVQLTQSTYHVSQAYDGDGGQALYAV